LQRWKGVHVFIEAVARLRATQLPLHAVIVGGPHETEPAYAGELRALAERLGVANAITFAGHQPNPLEWMQAMDVFVHTSDREPFGIVVVEAMALGKPVVAGAAGGPSDIITNGTDGLLAPYGDADAVAAAVTRYLQQPAFAQAVGTAAAQRAAAFSDVAYADAVCAAVRGFLERAA
jgi:glycosyltransferase involved in cell wall biosynthesis